MVTVARAEGLSAVIFLDDHPPSHAHVFGDGKAKINLLGKNDAPEVVWTSRMTRGELRRALRVVTERLDFLLQRWDEIHG